MFSLVILQSLFFFLPGFVANMLPIVFDRYRVWVSLAQPVDFEHRLRGEFLFGTHKTWRGLFVGGLGGTLTAGFQTLLYALVPQSHFLFLFRYDSFEVMWFGFLLGLGALLGDLTKSFFKRRLHIKDGAAFFPFDQLDYIVGGLFLGSFYFFPDWTHVVVLLVLTPVLTFLANVIAYFWGWKKVWW